MLLFWIGFDGFFSLIDMVISRYGGASLTWSLKKQISQRNFHTWVARVASFDDQIQSSKIALKCLNAFILMGWYVTEFDRRVNSGFVFLFSFLFSLFSIILALTHPFNTRLVEDWVLYRFVFLFFMRLILVLWSLP